VMLINQNCMYEEIKSSLNSGNVCYHVFQKVLSSHLLFKNVRFKIYKTVILLVALYECEGKNTY
jgi:hypothetical protein